MSQITRFFLIPLLSIGPAFAGNEADPPPHIVLILADDMGYGDVGALNHASRIPTPHLDRLANGGMTFTDAHTPASVCTPTRYAMLTGRYCWRTRLKRGVLNGYGQPLVEDGRQTMADLLGESGYTTGIVGKWHLGLGFAKSGNSWDFSQPVSDGPHTHGFDESFIIPASLDFPPYVYIRNGQLVEFPSETQPAVPFPSFLRKGEKSPGLIFENVLDDLADESATFIASQAKQDKPFFLYVPLTSPHKPIVTHPRFQGKSKLGPYGDFVMQTDAIVGKILNALDEAGIANDTLVVFTSDNGSYMVRNDEDGFVDHVQNESVQAYRSDHHRANGVLRGTKADIWEAGHRVPFFVRWPARVKTESQCNKTICLTDLFSTLAEVADAHVPPGQGPDSHSLISLLTTGKWSSPRPPVIHHSARGMFAVRDGQWKLVMGNGSGGRESPAGKPFAKPYRLFDLEKDISEQSDVSEEHPDVVARLEAEYQRIAELEESSR